MRKLKIFSLLALAGCLSASAYDFNVNGVYYNILPSTTNCEVTYASENGNSYTGAVTIPTSVTADDGVTYTVTAIGTKAFYKCTNLRSTNIPNTVTSIGEEAYNFCANLKTIVVPASVTSIGFKAFYCSLTSFSVDENNPTGLGV